MKFKVPVGVNVLSPLSFWKAEDFLGAVRTFCEFLPDLTPEKWGWVEPLKQPFEPDHLDKMVHANGVCETAHWKRAKRPKAEGGFSTRWKSGSPRVRDTHANISFNTELGQVAQEALITYVKQSSIRVTADIALIDVVSESYIDFARESESALYGRRFYLVTHTLRHWLPDVFWVTVFGPAYVRLFGKERLLTAPAFAVEELGPEMVYVQLTEHIADTVTHPELLQSRRDAFKKHVDHNAFFVSGMGYDRLKKGPFGDVFTTPIFDLVPDKRPWE